MQKISTHLWFDTEAKAAGEFYERIFPNTKITSATTLSDTPSGDVDVVNSTIFGHEFQFISAGPYFKINPSISFIIACESKDEVDGLWKKLSEGGQVMMELGEYPFSEWYGWIQDKFGVSWQLMYANGQPITQKLTPTLLFVGDVCGKAEEAINFYTSVFKNAKVGEMMQYGEGEEPNKPGTIKWGSFTLEGQQYAAMDSAQKHEFAFNEAVSFLISCDSQEEIDYFWGKLSAVPEAEQCGWVKDQFGVSWQIVPASLDKMMQDPDKEKVQRVTEAFLKMKKFDLAELERVYAGE